MNKDSLSLFVSGLRSVSACMAKDNSRYAISGVLVEPSPQGVRLVATDGHRLALALVPELVFEGLTKPIIISSAAVKAMTAKPVLDIEVADTGATVKTATGSSQFEPLVGAFPPYRDVVPTKVAPHLSLPALNPTLLKTTTDWSASEAFRAFATGDKTRPVLLLDPANAHWLAILMPVNVKGDGVWSEEDAAAVQTLTGKQVSAPEITAVPKVDNAWRSSIPVAASPEVAGRVGLPTRQAA